MHPNYTKKRDTKCLNKFRDSACAQLGNWFQILTVLGKKDPIKVQLVIEQHSLSMEVDTGAAVSKMSLEQQKTDLPNVVLKPSSIRLKTYTGERVHAGDRRGYC